MSTLDIIAERKRYIQYADGHVHFKFIRCPAVDKEGRQCADWIGHSSAGHRYDPLTIWAWFQAHSGKIYNRNLREGMHGPVPSSFSWEEDPELSRAVDDEFDRASQQTTRVTQQTTRFVRSKSVIMLTFLRDGFKCRHCGVAALLQDGRFEVDHIVPLHKSGVDHIKNTQVLCRNCHGLKTFRERT